MSRIVDFQNKIRTDNRVAAKADLPLRLVEQIVAECVISETGRRRQIDKSRQNVQMATGERRRRLNWFKRLLAADNQRPRQTFNERGRRGSQNGFPSV